MILQHWEPSCCMGLWQFPDSYCHGLTGISAILPLKKGRGALLVSDPYISPDSILQGWMVRSVTDVYMFNVMFKCWQGTAPMRLFQGNRTNHAEGWTERKIYGNCTLRAQAPSCLTFSSFLDYLWECDLLLTFSPLLFSPSAVALEWMLTLFQVSDFIKCLQNWAIL